MINKDDIFSARRKEIVEQKLEKEILIYDLQTNRMFSLNETSTLIYRLCDGKNSVADISRKLTFKMQNTITEDFVRLALEQLAKNNLLEVGKNFSFDFTGLSRREAIRRIGLTTAVALPLISSIIVPIAANAASRLAASSCSPTGGGALGCACTQNGSCPSGPNGGGCCSQVPGRARTCVERNTLQANGGLCGRNCDCISNNCNGATVRCDPPFV